MAESVAAAHRDDGVAGQHDVVEHPAVGVLDQQVAPARRVGPLRIDANQFAARRVEVGDEGDAAVATEDRPGLGVDAFQDDPPVVAGGPGRAVPAQISQVAVVAGGGPEAHRHAHPASVERRAHAEIGRPIGALAEDHDVLGRVGADRVEIDPPVVLLLPRRYRARRQPAHVVELVAAGQPGDRGVAGAVDRAVEPVAGRHVHDPQGALLVATLREQVGEPLALLGHRPAVEGHRVVLGQGARVDQQAPLAPFLHPERRVVLAGQPLEEKERSPITRGGPMKPGRSSSRRKRSRSRPARLVIQPRQRSSSAAAQARDSGSSGSSSQRYGSATRWPRMVSTASIRRAGG